MLQLAFLNCASCMCFVPGVCVCVCRCEGSRPGGKLREAGGQNSHLPHHIRGTNILLLALPPYGHHLPCTCMHALPLHAAETTHVKIDTNSP